MLASAVHDLPWYFGSGPDSMQGDLGLRSPFGAQLEASRVGLVGEHTVDASRSEDAVIARLSSAHAAGRIVRRLRALPRQTVEVLRLTFSGGSLPYAIDPAALTTASMRRLVVAQFYRSARYWIEEARARRKLICNTCGSGPADASALLEARKARHQAKLYRRLTIAPEVARIALHESTDAERSIVRRETDEAVRTAILAYETVRVESAGRPAPTVDPRPWRRSA